MLRPEMLGEMQVGQHHIPWRSARLQQFQSFVRSNVSAMRVARSAKPETEAKSIGILGKDRGRGWGGGTFSLSQIFDLIALFRATFLELACVLARWFLGWGRNRVREAVDESIRA
jgi:hypothetical protein